MVLTSPLSFEFLITPGTHFLREVTWVTKDDLLEHVPPESVDVVMLIFVLSAVHPDKMHLVLQNIYKVSDCEPAFEGSTS